MVIPKFWRERKLKILVIGWSEKVRCVLTGKVVKFVKTIAFNEVSTVDAVYQKCNPHPE